MSDGCRYNGHVVAKLPFEPFSLLAKLAHRGIPTPSANDCSFVSHILCKHALPSNPLNLHIHSPLGNELLATGCTVVTSMPFQQIAGYTVECMQLSIFGEPETIAVVTRALLITPCSQRQHC